MLIVIKCFELEISIKRELSIPLKYYAHIRILTLAYTKAPINSSTVYRVLSSNSKNIEILNLYIKILRNFILLNLCHLASLCQL